MLAKKLDTRVSSEPLSNMVLALIDVLLIGTSCRDIIHEPFVDREQLKNLFIEAERSGVTNESIGLCFRNRMA